MALDINLSEEILMLKYIIRRLLTYIPLLFALTIISFLYVHLMPGDPVKAMAGQYATPETVQNIRHQLGIDRPLINQYLRWMGGIFKGDFGISFITRKPITSYILGKLPATLELAVASMLFAILLSVPWGILTGLKKNTKIDYFFSLFSLLGLSTPSFWAGTIFMLYFALNLRWFRTGGYVPFTENPMKNLYLLFLPAFTLGFGSAPYLLRMTRAAVIETMQEPFITYARAKGIKSRTFITRYVFRHAVCSIIDAVVMTFSGLLGGSMLVEVLFTFPGMGRVIIEAVLERDYFVISTSILVFAGLYLLANLFADVIHAILDPRIQLIK